MLWHLLPSEIISYIASFLPTASCLWNLAQTCRFLYKVISADDYRIFREFVRGRFPGIDVPPLWKDAARALTSRSRALDRNAIVARYIKPSHNAKRIGERKTFRRDRPTLGYRPAIDSYEIWYGGNWFDRKEVLAWGAGAELMIRTTDFARVSGGRTDRSGGSKKSCQSGKSWVIFNDLTGVNSWDDICGVHLLRPAQTPTKFCSDEELVLGRRNGRMVRLSVCPEKKVSSIEKTYMTTEDKLESTDMSRGPCRVLAATFGSRSIAFYRVDADGDTVEPFATLSPDRYGCPRNSCSKMFSDDQIGVVAGHTRNKISIFAFTPDHVTSIRDIDASSVNDRAQRRTGITALESFNSMSYSSGISGQAFLTGWEDGSVRLHDQRSSQPYVASFQDTVDHCPTYCIHAISPERFLTGAGENALVKTFDMRMPGKYNYLDAGTPAIQTYHHRPSWDSPAGGIPSRELRAISQPQKDISLFLSARDDVPHNRLNSHTRSRYRGPVYTMTQPSPSSSAVYIGVEGGIISFDVASTDDILGPGADWYRRNINLGATEPSSALDFSPIRLTGYERPWSTDQSDNIHMISQKLDIHTLLDPAEYNGEQHAGCTPGLDCRWMYSKGRGRR